ncbi:hypothetical protein ZWY2020_044767 [Hordeum vulgare]|nr:hypothetical protein ZWY2020_044767 [Hordeum vulgare]
MCPSPSAVEFASAEGKRLFAEALQGETMEGFFNLISYFQTQSEPAFYGLTSLSVMLNMLAIDPGRSWKGPWRWFDESMLDYCEPLQKVKAESITFGKVVCLAHCASARVQSFRADQTTIHDFHAHLARRAASQDCHLISSYHRSPFKQTSVSADSAGGAKDKERTGVVVEKEDGDVVETGPMRHSATSPIPAAAGLARSRDPNLKVQIPHSLRCLIWAAPKYRKSVPSLHYSRRIGTLIV